MSCKSIQGPFDEKKSGLVTVSQFLKTVVGVKIGQSCVASIQDVGNHLLNVSPFTCT